MNLTIKKEVGQKILDKTISLPFSEKIKDEDLNLDEGIQIKTILFENIESWFSKTEADVANEMKELELKLYRELLPELMAQLKKSANNHIEKSHPEYFKGKNMFI